MTLALDTTALLARFLDGPSRPVVLDAMDADPTGAPARWLSRRLSCSRIASGDDPSEPTSSAGRSATTGSGSTWSRWTACAWSAPTELGRTQPLRTVDALHLAAADRLPRPVTFATFDPAQIPVALSMGFDVLGAPDAS